MDDMVEVWEKAAAADPSVAVRSRDRELLGRKRVRAEPFSRRRLFMGMAAGRVRLFTGLQIPLAGNGAASPEQLLLRHLSTALRPTEKVRIQTGVSRRRMRVPVPELLRRWEGGRAIVSVTDLHIRGTALEKSMDTSPLSEFNILCTGSDAMQQQEMMTMVVSSEGNVTDSHSDDPDGSNHCFTGRKLWLAWDTFEGRARGLEDVERDTVLESANFDMRTFLSLESARWFVVSKGDTLFLPGHLTHKVITVEQYLGVGSFYVALPNCIRTIARWMTHGPLWSLSDPDGEYSHLVSEIADSARRRIQRVRKLPPSARYRWGFPFLKQSVRLWEASVPSTSRARLLEDRSFAALLSEVAGQ